MMAVIGSGIPIRKYPCRFGLSGSGASRGGFGVSGSAAGFSNADARGVALEARCHPPDGTVCSVPPRELGGGPFTAAVLLRLRMRRARRSAVVTTRSSGRDDRCANSTARYRVACCGAVGAEVKGERRMTEQEKDRLLALFGEEAHWCQQSEARDSASNPVGYDDTSAVAWDLVGGLCHLFGWQRASELFGDVHRHVSNKPESSADEDEDMTAMSALFDFNDAEDMTYERVLGMLQGLRVGAGGAAVAEANSTMES